MFYDNDNGVSDVVNDNMKVEIEKDDMILMMVENKDDNDQDMMVMMMIYDNVMDEKEV